MAVREIVVVPDQVLRKKTKKVTKFDDKLQSLIDDMVETMREAPGVGLAAPQIGSLESVIVVEYYENEDEDEADDAQHLESEQEAPKKLYTIVNPEITRKSVETIEGTEGCLSVPGYLGEVSRHVTITVKGQTRYGQSVTLKLKDWSARIFQHEIDHLYGVLFTDLATKIWKPEEPIEDTV